MNMYEYKYKNEKNVKEKEDNSKIYQDSEKETIEYAPFLEKTEKDKERMFIPKNSLEKSKDNPNFTPFTEKPKETSQGNFIPKLTSDTKKMQKDFIPSIEPPKNKERDFIPNPNPKNTQKSHDIKTKSKQTITQPAREKTPDLAQKELLDKINEKITQLAPKFLEYVEYAKKEGKQKVPNPYPNRGARITDKFKNWIRKNEPDPNKKEKILKHIEEINKNNSLQKIIKTQVTSTNKSLKEISRNLKIYGINISPHTIKMVALKQIYENDNKQVRKRFPSGTGGFLQETYSLDKNEIGFSNIEFLQQKLIQYHEYAVKNNLKIKYANRGAKITNLFIKWLQENEKDIGLRKKLIESAKLITKNGEIPQYVMEKTINSKHSMRSISTRLKKKGIYLSHHAIGNYANEHVFVNQTAKIERFPSNTEMISQEIYEKIREEVKKFYPIPQRWISKKLGVSRRVIERIAKIENTREEYERKWPAREKIPDETRDSVIYDINNTKLNMLQIADKYDISPHSVKKFAQDYIFKDDEKSLRYRFPLDIDRLVGVLTHYCIHDELTHFFSNYYKETFYAEPRIYQNPSKGTDGLILNDQKFLQGRLKDPSNQKDLSMFIHNIPHNSLNAQFDHIKAIQFDFTNSINDDNIISKSIKYQRPDLMLYIVGTQWYLYDHVKPLPDNKEILYPENIKVISYELFVDLVKLQGKPKENFEHIIDLNYNSDFDALKKLHEENNIRWNNKTQLRNELKQKGLIKRSVNEYFKIPRKSKQMRLF